MFGDLDFGEAKFVLLCGNVKDFLGAEGRQEREEHLSSPGSLVSEMVAMQTASSPTRNGKGGCGCVAVGG